MRKMNLLLITALSISPLFAIGKVGKDCIFRGKKLGGRVKFVTNGTEDFRIKIVTTNNTGVRWAFIEDI